MKKPIFNLLIVNLIIIAVYFLCGLVSFALDISVTELYITNFIFIVLAVSLLAHVINHIAYRKQRIQLIIIASLILLFLILRGFKYISFNKIEVVARHIWYLYYLPIIFMPYLLLVTALTNYYSNHRKTVLSICIVTGLISMILFALIITNDLHQLAFRFKPEFVDWDNDHGFGFLFYLVSGYVILLFLSSFIVFYSQCHVISKRHYGLLSLIPLVMGLLWIVFDIFSLLPRYKGVSIFCLFPETFCFTVAGYLINLICLNFITSNKGYGDIFSAMSMPAVIRDSQGDVVFKNGDISLPKIPEEQVIINNNLYKKINIFGGNITWISDISDSIRVNKELTEINERLREEEQLHKLENTLKEEQLIISEKNKLYDEIARDVSEESNRIVELSKLIKKDNSLYQQKMPEILFLSIYIKRFANLKLLAKENQLIDLSELYLSINETLRYLNNIGVKTIVVGHAKKCCDSITVLQIYSFIFKTLIDNLPNLNGVTAIISDSSLLKIIIEAKDLSLPEVTLNKVRYSLNKEDDAYYIVFEGGKE